MEYIENNFTAPPNSDKIVMWRFLRNRRLILRLHRPTIFRALTYWAHRAVISAIAWFSCLFSQILLVNCNSSIIHSDCNNQNIFSQHILTAINLQYSANTAYWTRFSTNPAISFFSSTGDCPISFSSVIVVSVTHFSVYGAGTTSVSGQQNGGFICQSQ